MSETSQTKLFRVKTRFAPSGIATVLGRTALTALLVILSTSSILRAQAVTGPTPHNQISPNDFAIMTWGVSEGDQQIFNDIHDCGFNLAGFVHAKDLEKVKAAGLEAFVYDPSIAIDDAVSMLPADEITSRVKAVVEATSSKPAVFGYYFRDEPMPGAFPGLGHAAAAIKQFAPDKTPYINLLPTYGPMSSYRDYLTSFVQIVKPKILSYDHYAMMDDGSIRDGYFQNLEAVRDESLKDGIPFWNIVLSNHHFHYAKPSLETLRFQAFTTLAYGAKGISYFTYFAPQLGNYELAPIDQFGHKTPTWGMLQNVNLQLQTLAPAYVKLKSVGVFHAPVVPHDCKGIESSRFVKQVQGGQFCIGEFEDKKGRPYLMVVNTDLHNSSALNLTPKTAGQIKIVNAYNGNVGPWVGEDVWFAPGQGKLLMLPK